MTPLSILHQYLLTSSEKKKEKENHKLFFFHIPEQKRSCLLPKSPLIDVHTLGCIISKKIVDYHLGVVDHQNNPVLETMPLSTDFDLPTTYFFSLGFQIKELIL